MQFDKSQVLDLITNQGDKSKADQELPDTVDTDQHAGLLSKFGLDPKELISKLAGGGGLGKLLGG